MTELKKRGVHLEIRYIREDTWEIVNIGHPRLKSTYVVGEEVTDDELDRLEDDGYKIHEVEEND